MNQREFTHALAQALQSLMVLNRPPDVAGVIVCVVGREDGRPLVANLFVGRDALKDDCLTIARASLAKAEAFDDPSPVIIGTPTGDLQ